MKSGFFKTSLRLLLCSTLLGVFFAPAILKPAPVLAATGINKTINFQGRLLNSAGATVPDGFYNIEFKIYQDGDGQSAADATGSPSGSLKWTEDYLNQASHGVKVVNGYMSVQLGSITPFGASIDWNQDTLWLSMNIAGTGASCTPFSSCSPDGEMLPMQPLTAAPYALNAGEVGGLTAGNFVQLAQGAQTDSSTTNPSIFINKTGSTANILELQKASSDVMVLDNNGLFTLQPAANLTGTGTQTAFTQNITNAQTGGTVNGHLQTITVSNSSGTTTTNGENIAITDNGTTANADNTLNLTLNGSNTSATRTYINIPNTIGPSTTGINFGGGIGNGVTGGTGINFGSAGISNGGTAINIQKIQGSSTAINIGGTLSGGAAPSGNIVNINQSQTFTSGTNTASGVFLNVNRAFTNNNANTLTVSGDVADLASNCTVSAGACTDTGKILSLTQSYGSSTGNVLNVQGAGTGDSINASVTNTSGTQTNGISFNRNGSGGTTTNGVAVTSTLGTLTNGINVTQTGSGTIGTGLKLTGTFTSLISSSNFIVDNSGNVTAGTYNGNTFNNAGQLTFNNAGNASILSNSASTYNLTVDTGNTGATLNLGNTAGTSNLGTSNAAHTIGIGTGGGGTTTQAVTIGAATNSSSTLLLQGGNGTGAISLVTGNNGGSTAGSIQIGNTSGGQSQTINIGTNGTTSSTNVVNIATGGGTSGNSVTIGSNSSSSNSVTINGGTGAAAITLGASTTLSANNSLTYASGSGSFDAHNATGTFDSTSGTNQLNGNTTVTGSKTFTVNGGLTNLKAGATINSGATGTVGTIIQGASGQTAALLQLQDSLGSNLLTNDASGDQEQLGYLDTPYGGLGQYGNLLTRSEQFDQGSGAPWTYTNVTTPSANNSSSNAPDSTATAEALVDTSSGGSVKQSVTGTNTTYTFSVWLKATSTQTFALRIDSNGTPATGTAASFSATTTWQRFSVTQTFSSGVTAVSPTIFPGGTGASGSLQAWGAQLVQAGTSGVYTRTIGVTVAAGDGFVDNGTAIFQASALSTTAFQVQNTSGVNVAAVDTTNGQIVLGTGGAGGVTGQAKFNYAGQTGSITLAVPTSPGSTNYTINVPAENGTICTTAASAACTAVYAAVTGSGYIVLGPSTVQADSGTNNSIFINKTGASGNIVELQKSASDVFKIDNTGNVTSTGQNTLSRNGSAVANDYTLGLTGTTAATGSASLLRLGNAIASGNSVANGGTYIGINEPSSGAGTAADFFNFQNNNTVEMQLTSGGNLTVNGTYNGNTFNNAGQLTFNNAGNASILSNSASTYNLTVDTGNTGATLNLGNTAGTSNLGTSNAAHTIGIGTGGGGTTTQAVTIGAATNSSSTLLLQGGNGTGAISLVTGNNGGSTAGSIQIGNTSGGQSQTINIGTNGTTSSTNVVNIATGGGTSGNSVTIGSNSSSSNSVTINGGTGAAAITLGASTTLSANNSLTYASGSGSFDAHNATGTFDSTSGTNQLNGNTTVTGSKTFTVNGGLTNLKAGATINSGATGTVGTIIQGASGQTAALLQLQDSLGSNLLTNDASGDQEQLGYLDTPYGGLGQYGNLLTRSEQFDQGSGAPWTYTNVTTPSANNSSSNAPDSTATAEALVDTSSGGSVKQSVTGTNTTYTFSVWLKATSTQTFALRIDSNGTPATGTAASFSATTTWQRFSVTQTFSSGVTAVSPTIFPGGTGASGSLQAWGAQLVQAGTSGVYTRTIGVTVAAGDGFVDNGTAIFQASALSTTAFQVQNTSGVNVAAVDTTNGQIVLGTGGAGGVTGQAKFNYAGQTGSITLAVPTSPGSTNYTINVPAENGTICTTAASAACTAVYAAVTGSGYIVLGPSTVQADSGTNNSIFINKTGASGNIVELQKSASDVFKIDNTGNVTSTGQNTLSRNGSAVANDYTLGLTGTTAATGSASLLRLGNAIASGNSVANGGTYIGINEPSSGAGTAADFFNFQNNNTVEMQLTSGGNLTVNGTYNGNTFNNAGQLTFNNAGNASILSNSASTYNLTVDTGNTGATLNLGNTAGTSNLGTSNAAHTIGIGTGGGGTTTQAVTIGAATNSSSTLLLQGGNGTGAISLVTGNNGGSTAGSIQIGNTSGGQSQTINIGTNGTTSSTNVVNIATGGGTSGNSVTIGSNSSSSNSVTINGGTGAAAITLGASTTLSANNSLTYASGSGSFDAHNATGTFDSTSGTNQLNGNTTVTGSKTFTVNGGLTNLKAGATINSGATGTVGTIIQGASGQTAALLQLQDSTGANLLTVAAAGNIEQLGNINTPFGGLGAYGNLITYSEQLDNTAWVKTTASATANSQTAPDGTSTADTIHDTSSGGKLANASGTAVSNNNFTFSVWLKASNNQNVDLRIDGTSAGTGKTVTATTTWQRFSVTQNTNGLGGNVTAVMFPGTASGSDTQTVYAWGAQLTQTASSQVYVRSVGATVAANDGLINDGNAIFIPSGDSSTAVQFQNAAGADVATVDTTGGQVVLGTAGSGGVTGQLKFNFTGQTGSITLAPLTPASSNYTINLPAENGTICTSAAASACGTAGAGYVQFAPASVQADGTNNNSIYINKTSGTGSILVLQKSASPVFTVDNTGNVTSTGQNTLSRNGSAVANDYTLGLTGTTAATGSASLLRLGNAIASGNSVANGGTYIGINEPSSGAGTAADFFNFQNNNTVEMQLTSGGNLTVNGTYNGNTFNNAGQLTFNNAGNASILSNSASTYNLTVDTGNTGATLNLGNTAGTSNLGTSNAAHTIGIGTGGGGTTTQAVTIGAATNSSSTLLLQGGNGTGAISLVTGNNGGSTAGSIQIGNTSGGQSQTINIGTNGTTSSTNVVNIATGGGTSGNSVTIGSNSSSSNSVTINGGTGAAAITLGASTTLSANNSLTYASGSGSFDAHNATGTFDSTSGTNQLNGNTTVTGSKTFTVNGGLTNLKAGATINSGATGTVGTIIQGASGQTAALLQLQDSLGSNLLTNDASGDQEQLGYLDTPYGGLGAYSNLLTQSEAFNNAAWTNTGTLTVTANSVAGPDGTTNADTLAATSGGTLGNTSTTAAGSTYTFSVWLRATGTQTSQIRIDGATTGTGTAASITITSTWQRFSVTQNTTGFTGNVRAVILPGGAGTGSVYAWGAQLVAGTSPQVYIGTTANTVASGAEGLTVSGSSIFAPVADSTTAVQFQNASNVNVVAVDTTGGQIVLGTGGAGGVTGAAKFNFAGSSGSTTIAIANPGSNNFTLTIPTLSASANICTTDAVCGLGTGGTNNYLTQIPSSNAAATAGANVISPTGSGIVGLTVNTTTNATLGDAIDVNAANTSGTQTNGIVFNRSGSGGTTTNGININTTNGTTTNGLAISNNTGTTTNGISLTQSGGTFTTGLLYTGTFTNLISAPHFGINNSGNVTGGTYNTDTIDATHLTFSGAGGTITSTGSGNITLQAPTTNQLILNTAGAGQVLLGTSNSTTVSVGNTGSVTTIEGSSAAGGIAIGNGGTVHQIAIGSGSGPNNTTITIGSGVTGASNTSTVTIGSANAAGSTTLIQGGTGATAIQLQTAGGASSTISLANNAVAATVQIGTTATNTGNIQNINIGNETNAGTTNVVLGAFTGATGGTTQLQAVSTLTLQTAASGTIAIGNNSVANTVNIGATGAAATSTALNEATATGAAQTVKIGGTGGAAGNSNSGTTITLQAGGTSETLSNAGDTVQSLTNSATAFQIQNAAGNQILNFDTTNIATDITGGQTTSNLISNGSFESGTTGWVKMGATQVAVAQDTTMPYVGNNSLKVVGNATDTAGTDGAKYNLTTSTLVANTQYTFTAVARTLAGTSMSTLQIGYNLGTGGDVSCLTAQTVVSTGWTTYTCSFTVGTTTGTPYVYVKQTDAAVHTYYIDGVLLTRYSLLSNASVEQAITSGDWANKSTATVSRVTTQFEDGAAALKIVTVTNALGGTQHNETLNDSTQYNLSFWALLDTGSTALTTMEAGYSSDGSTDNTVCITGQTVTQTGTNTGWTNYTCSFVTPASHSGTPYIYIKGNVATARTFYIDNVQLTMGPPSSTYRDSTIDINGTIQSPVTIQTQSNSTTAFQVQNTNGTSVLGVDTANGVVTINSGTAASSSSASSGLRFAGLTSTSSGATTFTGILGLDTQGNVGLSQASVSLISPALAYWDGLNDPNTGSQAYPTISSVSGAGTGTATGSCGTGSWAPKFVTNNGEELTAACGNQSGSINWNFSQVSFEETQFQFKAGAGNGADSTWFYSYGNVAGGVPTSEFGCTSAVTSPCTATLPGGYVIYFSEWHHCAGVAWGHYDDGNQCDNGGGTSNSGNQPLVSTRLWNIGDNQFHDVDIQLRYNIITVRWDGQVILTYTDSFGRDLSQLGFGFGSRTGGSNNEHYIKGLLVTKLGSDPSKYNIDSITPLGGNLYIDNTAGAQKLGIGTFSPDSTLEVDGTESHKTVVTSGAGFAATNYVTMGTGTGITTSPACSSATGNGTTNFTASSTVAGTGTSFTPGMVGDQIVLPDGVIDTIATYTSSTSITTTSTHIECPGAYTVLTSAITIAGTSAPTISIGTTGSVQTSSTTHIADTSGATGTQTVSIGSAANAADSLTLEAGTGATNLFNGATAHTINLATGAAIQTITIGSLNSTSGVTLQGGIITTTNNQGGVDIGGGFSTSDTALVPLTLDSTITYAETANTCTSTVNDGSLYFNANTASMAVRACINGGWEDLVSTAGLGIMLYGVVADSGNQPGDLVGATATAHTTGPCKVFWASSTTVTVNPCIAYSGGRKVVVASATLTVPVTSAWAHICLTGTNNQPAASAASATETTAAQLPTFSIGAPVLCLADISTSGTAITGVFDVRTFTTSIKEFAISAAALGLGWIACPTTLSQVTTCGTASAGGDTIEGVVVATNATTSTTTPNVILSIEGPTMAKGLTTTNVSGDIVLNTTTANRVAAATATSAPSATLYANLGIDRSASNTATACTSTASAANCDYQVYFNMQRR